jgi:pimeloyl-ACP methyl ester carboxylesterase
MVTSDPRTVAANGLTVAYLEAGPETGPLALCLHGFPDTAHTFRHLLPALADAGFHAVAPWLRGYAPTSLPPDGMFQTGALAADACALHEVFGAGDDAVIIGSDWGAFAAYGAGAYAPRRWRRVVTMAVPPPAALATGFFAYDQLKRSFYVFFFQSPLAEMAVSLDDLSFIDRLWADWSPGYDAGWDLEQVKAAIGAPERLSAAIGYYRAMFDPARRDTVYEAAQAAADGSPSQPTLYLHGADDGCMGVDVIGDVLGQLAPGSRQVVVPGAGHFLQLEQPGAVNDEVLSFVTAG